MDEIDHLRRAFANILTERRLRKQWSQVELAAHSGMEHSYISRLEQASRTPSIDVLLKLAKAFRIAPETFLKEVRLEFERLYAKG